MHLWSYVFIIKSRFRTCNEFWHQLLSVRPNFTGQGHILHKTTLISDPSCRFGSPQAIFTFDQLAKIQGSHFPLRFDNSLERLTELSKVLYLLLQFYYCKKIEIRTSQRERCIVWGLRGLSKWSFHGPQSCIAHLAHWCMIICRVLATREAHPTPSIQGFYQGFIM